MQLSEETLAQLRRKLGILADAFPDVEIVDLDRLNELVVHEQINESARSFFLTQIEASGQRHLEMLGNACLEHNLANLAATLIQYCLDNLVITDTEQQRELVNVILRAVARFELVEYIDVEQQSSRIRFIRNGDGFVLDLNRIPASERLGILKLLRDSYVQRLLDEPLADDPDLQALLISKHNNVCNLIRTQGRSQLEEIKWARLYALEDLEYGPNTSSDLFGNALVDPVTFDEQLWRNFNILLLPALGNVGFEHHKIILSNEGRGCIENPTLEIRCEGTLVTKVPITDVVLAHKSCTFRLEWQSLRALRSLDPNGELAFHLVFSKFNSTPFRFVRTMQIGEVLESLDPHEQDIRVLAQRIGVSAERVKALAETHISSEQELFETVKKFILEIRRLVEQNDGHRILTSRRDDRVRVPRSEADIQVALKLWLRPFCERLNVDMNRESLTGRGPLDFKFSIGHDMKCLAEIKLFHSTRLNHGLEIQLPTYLTAENTRFGVYIPIIFEPSIYESKLKELETTAHALAQDHDLAIEVIDIKAWKPVSASKASTLEESGRYCV